MIHIVVHRLREKNRGHGWLVMEKNIQECRAWLDRLTKGFSFRTDDLRTAVHFGCGQGRVWVCVYAQGTNVGARELERERERIGIHSLQYIYTHREGSCVFTLGKSARL